MPDHADLIKRLRTSKLIIARDLMREAADALEEAEKGRADLAAELTDTTSHFNACLAVKESQDESLAALHAEIKRLKNPPMEIEIDGETIVVPERKRKD